MADSLEAVARVGLAAWVAEREDLRGAARVLGLVGDELQLIEIDAESRERILIELIDTYDVLGRNLRVEVVLFGEAGGFFACPLDGLDSWPKSLAQLPAEVFLGNHHKAAFSVVDSEIVMEVRHALRPGPPRRRFRWTTADQYEEALQSLARQSRQLRDALIDVAEQQAFGLGEALQAAFKFWPA